MAKKKDVSIRSGAAEYLTFVASTGDSSVEMRYEDENIWLTRKMMAALFGVDEQIISCQTEKIFEDAELVEEDAVRVDGAERYYALEMVIAVGFRVHNQRAVQFRKWANTIAKNYIIKGWVMDDERLKNGGSVLSKNYFEELLERIREIRLSERVFYQKITDIYATALDYDRNAKTTKEFFVKVQNKMRFAVHGHTAAEVIYERANADKPNNFLSTYIQGLFIPQTGCHRVGHPFREKQKLIPPYRLWQAHAPSKSTFDFERRELTVFAVS